LTNQTKNQIKNMKTTENIIAALTSAPDHAELHSALRIALEHSLMAEAMAESGPEIYIHNNRVLSRHPGVACTKISDNSDHYAVRAAIQNYLNLPDWSVQQLQQFARA
jgi:hypothetical protein